nr:alcohol dehydrogenase catalytic domain-containing protein [Geopsychrobacter electrodiphilus]
MKDKMKAAVVVPFGKPLEIQEWDVPTPGPGQILVKTEAFGVCHTDLHAWHGDWPVKPTPPFISGHEGIGSVVAMGAGVTIVKIGDRVGGPWLYSACGHCEYCLSARVRTWPNRAPSRPKGKSKPISSCNRFRRSTRSWNDLNRSMWRHAWFSTSQSPDVTARNPAFLIQHNEENGGKILALHVSGKLVKAETNAEPEASAKAPTDLTPGLVIRVHALYGELGRKNVKAVEDMKKADRDKRSDAAKTDTKPEDKAKLEEEA